MQQLKRYTAMLLFAAMVVGLLAGVPGSITTAAAEEKVDIDGNPIVNLMDGMNPSFEEYSIPNWTISEGVFQSDEQVYGNGSWSLKIVDNSESKAYGATNQKTAIQAGIEYTISAQVYGEAKGELTLFFYDASGVELTDQQIVLTSDGFKGWQELSREFVAPENATHVAVKVSSTASGVGDIFFDAVILAEKPKAPFVPSLPNGDFDTQWDAGIAPGWISSGAVGTKYTCVPNGEGYAMGVTKQSGSGYTFRTDYFPIEGGHYYAASIDVKLKTGNTCQLYLRFFDENQKQLAQKAYMVSGDYTDNWYTAVVAEKAPDNATQAYILITDPGYNSGVSYFDNAKIEIHRSFYNGSFEGTHTYEYVPAGFLTYGANMNVVTKAAMPEYVRTGNQAFASKGSKQVRSIPINVKAGEDYEVSIYVKREAGYTDDGQAQLYFRFYNESGAIRQVPYLKLSPVSSDEWTKMTLKGTAQDGEIAADIVFVGVGESWYYFDDAEFTQLTDYNLPRNLLSNGSFDTRKSANNTPLAQWYASSSNNVEYFQSVYEDEERGFIARFYNATYIATWTAPIEVVAGEKYSITLDAKGTGRVQAYIYYYANESDARGDYITGADGKGITKFTTSPNLRKGVWEQVAVGGSVAPEGAKYARVWIIGLRDTNTDQLDLYVDDIYFFQGLPKLVIPGEEGVLPNAGFEEIDEAGNPVGWGSFGTRSFSVVDANENPDDVFEGRYALKISVPATQDGTHGVIGQPFPIKAGMTYKFSCYVKEITMENGRPYQIYINYYDKLGDRVAAFFSNTAATGEWNYCDVSGAAPDSAVYARVQMVSGAGKGISVFDKLVVSAEGDAANPVVPVDMEWKIVETDHPRVYFGGDGYQKMVRFSKSNAICAFGYMGKATMADLITEVERYMDETFFAVSHKGMRLEYQLVPKVLDPTNRIEYETPPEGFSGAYPYMTAVGQRLHQRLEALALAYSLTGEVRYAERAIQYAVDICDWEYWVGYYANYVIGGGSELSSQVTGDLCDAVIKVYDMCYDQLTSAQKDKIYRAVVDMALEPMYHDCVPRMERRRDMDHATLMVRGALALATEENLPELKKYIDMGMTYTNWRLEDFLNSGINEGHMYDSLAIDDIVVTLYSLQRVTGYAGPIDHPYMSVLRERVLGFFDPVKGQLPAYSDSDFKAYYPYSMAIFGQQGDQLATYYLSLSEALSSNYDKLVYYTSETIDTLETPDPNDANVSYCGNIGFGALRTGFGALDSLLTISCNNSQQEHNHFDQNSLLMSFNGTWILSDTEYKDNSYSDLTTYQMKYTNTTIFVDGKPQVRKGQGSLDLVFDGSLYGYMIGSAPDAYGMEDKKMVLNKFDRHTIMVNHDSHPYYIIIDDLESNKERNFGWNLYTNGWDRLELDGQMIEKGSSGTGNEVAISRFGSTLRNHFVGNSPVTSKEVYFAGYGPTLLLESEKATKYQFMNIMSITKGSGSQNTTLFEELMEERQTTERQRERANGISWSSSATDMTKMATLSVTIGGPLVMFRAGKVGDWIEFPFTVEKDGEFGVTIDVGRSRDYGGTWNLYIDGELIEIYEPKGPLSVFTIDAGKRELKAGLHHVKVIMSGTTATPLAGTIMSVGSITLDTGESVGKGPVNVVETYDTDSVLGATVSYGTVLRDVILFNRGTGNISAGNIATDGQQSSILGLYEGKINEGYAVTKATNMKFGDKVLMTADRPVSIAVDFTFVNKPIKNTLDGKEVVLHEDFDIDEPVITVAASADAPSTVTFYVGKDNPYKAMVNGVEIASSFADGMLTLTVPAGDHVIKIEGHHNCVFDQYATHILNVKEWADCDSPSVYYVSCVCQRNGTETFVDGTPKAHSISAVKAKDATDTQNGNIAHYKCRSCKKLFADKAATQELSESEVIILSGQAQRGKIITIILIVAAVLVVIGVATILVLKFKFGFFTKKANEETTVIEDAAQPEGNAVTEAVADETAECNE